MSCDILLYSLAKADGQFLTCVACNTLWSVGHKRIWQPFVDECTDKLVWVEDSGVGDYWHSLDISYFLYESPNVFITNLGRNEVVS